MEVEVELPVMKWQRFKLKNGSTLKVPLDVLERAAQIAASDPTRVDGETVRVPVTWLVGERVGY